MYKILLVQNARFDINDIQDYYDSVKTRGGFAFSLELENAIERLEENPYLFVQQFPTIRRSFIQNYPYVIFYRILEIQKEVQVLALLHEKRNGEYIKKRLGIL